MAPGRVHDDYERYATSPPTQSYFPLSPPTPPAESARLAQPQTINRTRAGGLPRVDRSMKKPNILYIMADQMAAPAMKMHDSKSPIKTPYIDALAREGVVFDNAYCNAPLCAPSRFCLVSGQLPHKIGANDNASQLSSEIPTYAHYLRREGYETVLAGKMHFIGPDQLHGYENRLTPDIYPGDFGWGVNWDEPDVRQEWYHNMSSVLQAGVCVRSNQLDYDEEVMHKSTQYLYDYVRQDPETQRPFAMTVSLTHPHDPYAITQEYWDRYDDVEIPMPSVNIPENEQDPHSIRILKCIDQLGTHIPDEAIKRARRAYYGACSYVDDQVGRLMKTLKNCGLADNTIVVFSGDHGDMLGERGMWYKMSFLEMSARVPMVVHCPSKFTPRRVKQPVSTMDLLPTFVDMIGAKLNPILELDGRSLYQAILGVEDENHTVYGEYMGEGTITPVVMIRRRQYKYITSLVDPPQLFNLHDDPKELDNLCESKEQNNIMLATKFANEAAQKWDLQKMHDDTVTSQRKRRFVWEALTIGRFESWDYQPIDDARQKYVRSNIPLDDLERRARFPVVDMMGRVSKVASAHGVAGAAGQ